MPSVNDPELVHLVDRNPKLTAAWREVFREHPEVHVAQQDLFSVEADALVSPANCFGIMDGGLDAAIRDELGLAVEHAVRDAIERDHHGELPIGVALVVATSDRRWPWLVCAPTMRVPEDVSRSLNAYLAFRAALLAVRRHNAAVAADAAAARIRTLVCPGLCTGIGRMPPRRAAAQMRVALRQVQGPAGLPPFEEIHRVHRAMHTAE